MIKIVFHNFHHSPVYVCCLGLLLSTQVYATDPITMQQNSKIILLAKSDTLHRIAMASAKSSLECNQKMNIALLRDAALMDKQDPSFHFCGKDGVNHNQMYSIPLSYPPVSAENMGLSFQLSQKESIPVYCVLTNLNDKNFCYNQSTNSSIIHVNFDNSGVLRCKCL